MRKRSATRTMLTVGVIALAAVAVPCRGTAAAGDAPVCRAATVPVSVGIGGAVEIVYGELCLAPGANPATVQVLIPGTTYGHVYYDFPYQPDRYSYVRNLTRSGYATFNIDRLGTGLSSHPLSVAVTTPANAVAVHQVVQALRGGAVLGHRFQKVVLVGHSYGSIVLWYEAGTFHDVDGVIVTGWVHAPTVLSPLGVVDIAAYLYPAILDPRFSGSGLDPGYLTTKPGTRAAFFYDTADADPNVIGLDEATKAETASDGEASGFASTLLDPISERITVPVLVVVGQHDMVVCGTLAVDCSTSESVRAAEASHYGAQACLQTFVLPNSGHSVNLHLNASDWFTVARNWSDSFIGPSVAVARHGC